MISRVATTDMAMALGGKSSAGAWTGARAVSAGMGLGWPSEGRLVDVKVGLG